MVLKKLEKCIKVVCVVYLLGFSFWDGFAIPSLGKRVYLIDPSGQSKMIISDPNKNIKYNQRIILKDPQKALTQSKTEMENVKNIKVSLNSILSLEPLSIIGKVRVPRINFNENSISMEPINEPFMLDIKSKMNELD